MRWKGERATQQHTESDKPVFLETRTLEQNTPIKAKMTLILTFTFHSCLQLDVRTNPNRQKRKILRRRKGNQRRPILEAAKNKRIKQCRTRYILQNQKKLNPPKWWRYNLEIIRSTRLTARRKIFTTCNRKHLNRSTAFTSTWPMPL